MASKRWLLRYYSLILLKHDLPAGLTVFFVALPLCLGVALASGAPLSAGILAGIIGGLFVPLLSRSELSVSGPAAGLATVVAAAILSSGSYERFLCMLLVAGAVQVALGVLRMANIANYFPSAVIKGLLAAIGLLLMMKQLPIALGYGKPDFWSQEFINLITNTHIFSNLESLYFNLHPGVMIISVLTLATYILFNHPRFKRFAVVPVPLLLVVLSILICYIYRLAAPSLALSSTQLVHIPANLFSSIHLPDFSAMRDISTYKTGVVIGILASLETLLSIEAIDKLDPWHRSSPLNRDLIVQGLANLLCGLIGALPITAVIVRSSANIDAGGRTRMSAFVHGLLMLVAVAVFPFLIDLIPYAVLAAILVITGYNLTRPKLYYTMFRLGWNQFLPFILTIVGILFTDLLIGVSIGLVLSIYYLITDSYKVQFDLDEETRDNQKHYTLWLHSNVSFLDKVKIKSVLDSIPNSATVMIDGSQNQSIHYDVLEAIAEFEETAKRRNINVITRNVRRVEVLGH